MSFERLHFFIVEMDSSKVIKTGFITCNITECHLLNSILFDELDVENIPLSV